MNKFREVAHFIIIWVGSIIWGIGNCFYVLMALTSVLAKKVHPKAVYGNCWSYAIPLWVKYGGNLEIRAADGNYFLWIFPVLHVKYIGELPRKGVRMRQFVPIDSERRTGRVFPWWTVYYKGVVRRMDSPHDAEEGWVEASKLEHELPQSTDVRS